MQALWMLVAAAFIGLTRSSSVFAGNTTSRVSATCTASTSFYPVTLTITTTEIISSVCDPVTVTVTSSSTTAYSTTVITSFIPITTTLTITESANPASSSVSVSGSPTYYYQVSSGSTIWQDGISPSSGELLTLATTTVLVTPVLYTGTSVSITLATETTRAQTFTPPAFTSTVFSLQIPTTTVTSLQVAGATTESSHAPDETLTSTSTHYTTVTLSEVDPSMRTTFTSINSDEWNTLTHATSALSYDPTASTESSAPTSTSTTMIHVTSTSFTTMYSTVTLLSSQSGGSSSGSSNTISSVISSMETLSPSGMSSSSYWTRPIVHHTTSVWQWTNNTSGIPSTVATNVSAAWGSVTSSAHIANMTLSTRACSASASFWGEHSTLTPIYTTLSSLLGSPSGALRCSPSLTAASVVLATSWLPPSKLSISYKTAMPSSSVFSIGRLPYMA